MTYVAWEFIQRQSVKYYSDLWKVNYAKFLESELIYNNSDEVDGTLDRYIELVINCNEIDHTNEKILAYLTYYIMYKGYTKGTQYFPAYFDICKQAFEVISSNM